MTNHNEKKYRWLDPRNKEQLEWLNQYILKKMGHNPSQTLSLSLDNETQYNRLVAALEQLSQTRSLGGIEENGKARIDRARNAWQQHLLRQRAKEPHATKNKLSTYINWTAARKLKEMAAAKRTAKNKLLEDIINEAHQHYFHEKSIQEIKETNDRLKNKNGELQKKLDNAHKQLLPLKEQITIKNELAKRDKLLKQERALNDSLLFAISKYSIANPSDPELTPSQYAQALAVHTKLINLPKREYDSMMKATQQELERARAANNSTLETTVDKKEQ